MLFGRWSQGQFAAWNAFRTGDPITLFTANSVRTADRTAVGKCATGFVASTHGFHSSLRTQGKPARFTGPYRTCRHFLDEPTPKVPTARPSSRSPGKGGGFHRVKGTGNAKASRYDEKDNLQKATHKETAMNKDTPVGSRENNGQGTGGSDGGSTGALETTRSAGSGTGKP